MFVLGGTRATGSPDTADSAEFLIRLAPKSGGLSVLRKPRITDRHVVLSAQDIFIWHQIKLV
jgi:hypothetical protein